MLSEKKIEVLEALVAFDASLYQWIAGWARPMDVGAWDASHHSGTLRQLAIEGLVECRSRHGVRILTPEELRGRPQKMERGRRGSPKVYRITEAGRKALDDAEDR